MKNITIHNANDDALQAISKEHGLHLSLDAMRLLRTFYEHTQHAPTIADLQTIARWQPINPAKVTLHAGTEMGFPQRLLAILAILATDQVHKTTLTPDTKLDPYALAWATIDVALGRLVAAGADPEKLAIEGDFQWEIPHQTAQLGAWVRLVQGVCDTAVSTQTSLTFTHIPNDKQTVLQIKAKNTVPNALNIPAGLQQAGNFLFIVGDTRAELGGSHFNQAGGRAEGSRTPPKPMKDGLTRMRLLHQAMQAGLVQACRACEAGGIITTLATMCLAGELGAELQLIHVPRDWHAAYSTDEVVLFAESMSRFIVEVAPEDAPAFRQQLADVPHECVAVVGGENLIVNGRIGAPILTITLTELAQNTL